jgi:hypothetical protein
MLPHRSKNPAPIGSEHLFPGFSLIHSFKCIASFCQVQKLLGGILVQENVNKDFDFQAKI